MMRRNGLRWRWARRGLLLALAGAASFMSVILLIPGILVNSFDSWKPADIVPPLTEEFKPKDQPLLVPVYLTEQKKTVQLPLEEYVRGVLAAEMPVEFELEALKAQAIAARTYYIRRLELSDTSQVPEEAEGAVVTDTEQHQVFITDAALRERWGMLAYAQKIGKLKQAVEETEGIILTYEGEPIEATFFSTSNGFTENSEDYWQAEIPYLRSVASPWDKEVAPEYEREHSLTYAEFYKNLGLPPASTAPAMKVAQKSPGGRIVTIDIAGRKFTGRQVREKLGLASTDFRWKAADGHIVFTATGYGHGVGMSQWGANGMAKQGMTAEQILRHYYTGVTLETIDGVQAKIIAKK